SSLPTNFNAACATVLLSLAMIPIRYCGGEARLRPCDRDPLPVSADMCTVCSGCQYVLFGTAGDTSDFDAGQARTLRRPPSLTAGWPAPRARRWARTGR